MRLPLSVLVALVLGAGVVAWQNSAASQGRTAAPVGAIAASMSPVQRFFKRSGAYWGDVGRVIIHRGDLASRNRQLEGRVADLEGQNERLSRLHNENRELRANFSFRKSPEGARSRRKSSPMMRPISRGW